MLDIGMSRNPLAQEVTLIFNNVIRDHYRDVIGSEVSRYAKLALVKKDTDLNYVQELGDILVEDVDAIPWTVSMTMTGLPRIPKMDDQLIIDRMKYTVSAVKPVNRGVESVVLLYIYPERTDPMELSIESLELIDMGTVSKIHIVYSGYPTQFSYDGVNWYPFSTYIDLTGNVYKTEFVSETELAVEVPKLDVEFRVYLKDSNTTVCKALENAIKL